MSDIRVVVYTGGPCAGKSSILPIAKQWLEDRGYIVAVLPEVATELITAGFSPLTGWTDTLDFQKHLLEYQQDREQLYWNMLMDRASTKPRVLICDRGALDSIAYIGRDTFREVAQSVGTSIPEILDSYDQVIHLRSTARGAAEYYTLANNNARSESVEDAAALDEKTEAAWLGHPHFTVIDNRADWKVKVRRALAALARVLHIPEPKEVERKFVVERRDEFPSEAVSVYIRQAYLTATSGERRVRERTFDGVTSFYYTEKRETDTPGVRVEHERQISEEEYEALLKEADPALEAIYKTRYSFTYKGQHLEFDFYRGDLSGLMVLEAEVENITDEVPIPDGWVVREVTGNKAYSNAQLARHGRPKDA